MPIVSRMPAAQRLWKPNQDGLVTFGAIGPSPGFAFVGTGGSITHTPLATDNAVLVAMNVGVQAMSSVTYGGVAMTLLAFADTGSSRSAYIYGLRIAPGGGAQTVVVTKVSGSSTVTGTSVSYSGVTGFGTGILATGSSTTPSIVVPSAVNHKAFNIIAASVTNLTSVNQTSRYQSANTAAVIQDAPGAASVTLSAIYGTTGVWAMAGVDIK